MIRFIICFMGLIFALLAFAILCDIVEYLYDNYQMFRRWFNKTVPEYEED